VGGNEIVNVGKKRKGGGKDTGTCLWGGGRTLWEEGEERRLKIEGKEA
jgi:hypothetical protein